MAVVSRVNEARRLLRVDRLREGAIEEGIIDVELVHRPITGDGEGRDSADGGRFHDRAKSFVEVDAVLLGKTSEDPASLVAIKGAIGFELMTIYPFAGDDVGARRTRDELPRV